MKNVKVELSRLISFLGDSIKNVFGPKDIYIDNISDGSFYDEFTLDWVNSLKPNKQELAESTLAKVLIVDHDIKYSEIIKSKGKTLIIVEEPRKIISKILTEFFLEKKTSYIHPTAIIHYEAQIDPTAYIDAGCVIGKSKIGKNTVLRANVTIYDNVLIGNDCIIQACTVIGTDGLGCSREVDGTLLKFPHLGGVVIGNNVEIGANCQVARGALSNTIINDGCKINGMCYIAHNCKLGKNVWISPNTSILGSSIIEDNVTLFSSVTVRDQRKIGKGAIIAMGSIVTKDVPAGETWLGFPAKKIDK